MTTPANPAIPDGDERLYGASRFAAELYESQKDAEKGKVYRLFLRATGRAPGDVRSGPEASRLVTEGARAAWNWVASSVGVYSPAQWLFLLRCFPLSAVEGQRPTTGRERMEIAELVSGSSPRRGDILVPKRDALRFIEGPNPMTAAVELVAHAAALQHLRVIQRFTNKGVSVIFNEDFGASVHEAPPGVLEAINLVDERNHVNVTNDYGHIGGTVGIPQVATTVQPDTVVLWNRATTYPGQITNVPVPGAAIRHAAFYPSLVSNDYLDLMKGLRLPSGQPWHSTDLPLLHLLLRTTIIWLVDSGDSGFGRMVCKRGFVVFSDRDLGKHLVQARNTFLAELGQLFPDHDLTHAGATRLVRECRRLGTDHTDRVPRIVRSDHHMNVVDFVAATDLYLMLCTLSDPGDAGNLAKITASDFEAKVQAAIDRSSLAPPKLLRRIRGRSISFGGFKSEIDAIAVLPDNRILIVECKGLFWTNRHASGVHAALRNAESEIDKGLAQIQGISDGVRRVPAVAGNYDFSAYAGLEGVVCTPLAFYTADPRKNAYMRPGLRKVSSFDELLAFLAA